MFNVSTDDDEKKTSCPFEEFDNKVDAGFVLNAAHAR